MNLHSDKEAFRKSLATGCGNILAMNSPANIRKDIGINIACDFLSEYKNKETFSKVERHCQSLRY